MTPLVCTPTVLQEQCQSVAQTDAQKNHQNSAPDKDKLQGCADANEALTEASPGVDVLLTRGTLAI